MTAALAACVSCAGPRRPAAEWHRFEFDRAEMGVPFRIVLYAADPAAATNAASAAYDRIAQLNGILSDYDADSEVSKLSHTSGTGAEIRVSADLWNVLERAQQLARTSDGAFDATVGPVVNLWRQARRQGRLPDPAKMAKAMKSVGHTNVVMNNATKSVKLLAPGMRLDFGGIAKGYAVDQGLAVLRRFGLEHALVSGGGDIAVGAAPPGKRGWRVELPPLDASNAPPARFVLLQHAGLSTSGDLFQRLEANGIRYSHLIDPRTGMGLTDHSLVTVIAKDDFTADGLTKVMSVLPPERALEFLAKRAKGAEARIVRQPGTEVELHESPGFPLYFDRDPR